MMRRLGSSTATKSSPTNTTHFSKRSFVGFVPLDRHFSRAMRGGQHPSFPGARVGGGGGAFAGSSGTSADPFRSTSSAPLTPEDLFRHVMRQGGVAPTKRGGQRNSGNGQPAVDPLSSLMGMKPSSSSTTTAAAAPKPQQAARATAAPPAAAAASGEAGSRTVTNTSSNVKTTPSTSSSSTATAKKENNNNGTAATNKKKEEDPQQHPFMTLLETLGEAAPLMIHESLNHSTVEIELPLNVEIKNPKVSLNRPGSSNKIDNHPASVIESLLLGKKRGGEGNVTVSADITPKLSIEKKVEQKKESDKVKEMLQQWGLPVEHVEVFTDKYGLDSVQINPMARKFERTFFIDESVYNIEEATPFIEDGMLRLYVPKKKFTEMEKVSKEVVEEAVAAKPEKKVEPVVAKAPASCADSGKKMSTSDEIKSFVPEDLPKASKVVETETTSTTSSASPSSTVHSENFATSFAPRAPVNSSTHGTVAWPPRVETNNESPKFTRHTVSIPTAVDADTISLDIVESSNANGFAQDSGVLKLEVQQKSTVTALNQGETQVFTFFRFFEVPAEVDVEAVTCDFDAESRDLVITVPKPEPKKPEATPRRRIQINRKH